MSRRGFEYQGNDVVVGWDNPTQTFFGDHCDVSTMLDMGRFDIDTVDELAKVMRLEIPENISAILEADKASAPEQSDTQKLVQQMFGK